jgi:hypothetical protein
MTETDWDKIREQRVDPVKPGKTAHVAENGIDEEVVSIASKRVNPAKKAVSSVITKPIVFTFTDGDVAGTIKFIKKDDSYTREGKLQKYPTTKIMIQVIGMDKPFAMTREIFTAFQDSLQEPACVKKIEEWLIE